MRCEGLQSNQQPLASEVPAIRSNRLYVVPLLAVVRNGNRDDTQLMTMTESGQESSQRGTLENVNKSLLSEIRDVFVPCVSGSGCYKW